MENLLTHLIRPQIIEQFHDWLDGVKSETDKVVESTQIFFQSPAAVSSTTLGAGIVFTATLLLIPGVNVAAVGTLFFLVLSAGGTYVCLNYEEIAYEVTLAGIYVLHASSDQRYPWYNEILPGELILGAIPLKQHQKELREAGIKSVLSIVQPFENQKDKLFLCPITPEEWNRENVAQKQICCKDFGTVPLDQLHEGVLFLVGQKGKKTYVHCKAGQSRSALTVACYLMQTKGWTIEQTIAYLKKKRPVVRLGKEHQEVMMEYRKQYILKN